ncbi:hypothetical protein BCR34DRAFT_299306 [Clohesyomyces aquaticus]|uniref:Uncharacterized protein n=1 Tax=Clohesyomyces aquaticus TaxID=1231657 RepID=A0A1Y1XYT7_9PLEO|nr:hypothetical protein BCR34DRAFT_299306 [Clohesyomyces aquaticus]
MPTHRGVSVALCSQWEAQPMAEYEPIPQDYYDNLNIPGVVPQHINEETATRCVYVLVQPRCQFWLTYSIAPPVPEEQGFLFKLYINNAPIVNWSCGKDEDWYGTTMFGLYEKDQDGKKRYEKRMFFFTGPGNGEDTWKGVTDPFDMDACVEVRVHRTHGRMRIPRESKQAPGNDALGKGMDLTPGGRARSDIPKRFYKFALIDPIDQPFVTFRWFYRSKEQMEYLGLVDRSDKPASSRDEPATPENLSSPRPLARWGRRVGDKVFRTNRSRTPTSQHADHYIPKGAPRTDGSDGSPKARHSGGGTPPQFHRLSGPPSLKPSPPKQRSQLPSIPMKHDDDELSPAAYRPHPAYPVDEWTVTTPSPVKSIRDGISTPPLRRRGISATTLMNVVSNALKRRTPGAESEDGGSRKASGNTPYPTL